MKITQISDLHLEFHPYDISNHTNSDVLILAGDICLVEDLIKTGDNIYHQFFKKASNEYKDIIYVAGNHELYHGKFHSSLTKLRSELKRYPNIHFLENESITIDDVTFIGATLWTDINKEDPISMMNIVHDLNDYRLIKNDLKGYRKISSLDVIQRHYKSKEYISNQLKESDKAVIVTHHAPSKLSIHPHYKHCDNSGYASSLEAFILDHPQIKHWSHGHVHWFQDYMIDKTRITCNPRGYVTKLRGDTQYRYEETKFSPKFFFNI